MSETLKFGNGQWAVKEGSALAYNSENGNFKPLPFTFDRSTSATRVNKEGLIEVVSNNEPRIDFLNDSKGALKLEPSRSNLYTYSNDVSFWTKSNVITTSDYAISPDGTQNAFRAAFSSSTGLLYVTATGTTGTNNTLSVWAKSNNGSSNKFRFFANGNTTLSNDFIATDEWQRFEFTFNCTSVTAGLTGASDSATNDIIFYGFQHEEGSYATSYIPTQGSIGTRVAETCEQTPPSDIINSSEGVFYAEMSALANDGLNRYISLSDGSSSNKLVLRFNTFNEISGFVIKDTVQATFSYDVNILNKNKVALKYKENDFALWVNGVEVGTDTSGLTPVNLSLLRFEDGVNNGQYFYGNLNDLKLYNTALTDQELINLTTI